MRTCQSKQLDFTELLECLPATKGPVTSPLVDQPPAQPVARRRKIAPPKHFQGVPLAGRRAEETGCLFLSDIDVAKRYSVARPTVWRWAKETHGFPKPIHISPGTTRWRLSDLVDYEAAIADGKSRPKGSGGAK